MSIAEQNDLNEHGFEDKGENMRVSSLEEAQIAEERYKERLKAQEDLILTNASVPIFLCGKEFKAKCPSDRDYTELNEWIRAQFIKIVRKACEDLTFSERRETIGIAVREVASMTWDSGEGAALVNSAEGVAYMAYLMLKDNHPKITHAELTEACKARHNQEEVGRVFDYFQGIFNDLNKQLAPPQTSSGVTEGKN